MDIPELKDGMLLHFNIGDEYYVCGAYLCSHRHEDSIRLTKLDKDLRYIGECDPPNCLDVKKITYMGEVVWERRS